MASSSTPYLSVTLHKGDITNQVLRVDVEDNDRGADKATVVMTDAGSLNSDGVAEGMPIRIELGWETEHAVMFDGRVKATRSVADNSGRQRIEVLCIDMTCLFMDRPPKEGRTFEGKLDTIIGEIAKRAKMVVGAVSIDPMPKLDSFVQGERTDWQVLQDLADRFQSRVFVEFNLAPSDSKEIKAMGGAPKLYFVSTDALMAQDPQGTLQYCRGMGHLLEFRFERSGGGASPSASAAVADPDTGKPIAVETPAKPPQAVMPPSATKIDQAYDVLGPGAAADYAAARQNAVDAPVQPADQLASQHVAGLPAEAAEEALQRIRQDPTRYLGYRGNGLAMGTVFLRAKGSVIIQGIASTAAGRWYLSRVNHIVERATIGKKTSLTYRTRLEATR